MNGQRLKCKPCNEKLFKIFHVADTIEIRCRNGHVQFNVPLPKSDLPGEKIETEESHVESTTTESSFPA